MLKKIILACVALLLTVFLALEASGYYLARKAAEQVMTAAGAPENAPATTGKALTSRNAALEAKIKAAGPKGPYIVIDTAKNILSLREGDRILLETLVSCGSGNVLNDVGGQKTWTFDTPHGEFEVRSKVESPAWIKPDWAFVEEGTKIPPKNSKDRVETGVLGDYAMGFGDGFFIHGTLYTRLLGRNVTHGCVRVKEADLDKVFAVAKLGTKIFIF